MLNGKKRKTQLKFNGSEIFLKKNCTRKNIQRYFPPKKLQKLKPATPYLHLSVVPRNALILVVTSAARASHPGWVIYNLISASEWCKALFSPAGEVPGMTELKWR